MVCRVTPSPVYAPSTPSMITPLLMLPGMIFLLFRGGDGYLAGAVVNPAGTVYSWAFAAIDPLTAPLLARPSTAVTQSSISAELCTRPSATSLVRRVFLQGL